MKCFYRCKDKSSSRRQRSAPELETSGKSINSETGNRVIKSSCSASSAKSIPELYEEKAKDLRLFSYLELRQATNDFSRLLKIGEGGFGSVYKGWIKPADGKGEHIVVAIKKLNQDGVQGHKQWVAEVQFLGVVDHPNLVKLIGYCAADGERGIQRLLVYEFMPNKSLEDHLFSKAHEALSWQARFRIILGAAQGLEYLHEGLEVQVIHRDFKSSNILLDEEFKAKLSDFGLAREGPTADQSHVSTAVVGTHGYAAPDYIETGHLTTKSDVWSFGVVLYEVLTGRKSLDLSRPRPEHRLLDWARQYPADSKRFVTIMDPRLQNHYSVGTARKIAKLAESCLHKNPKERPKMSQVVQSLMEIAHDASWDRSPIDENNFNSQEESRATEPENKASQDGVPESWKRRMAHLAKVREHVESSGRTNRRFLMIQRAKVQ